MSSHHRYSIQDHEKPDHEKPDYEKPDHEKPDHRLRCLHSIRRRTFLKAGLASVPLLLTQPMVAAQQLSILRREEPSVTNTRSSGQHFSEGNLSVLFLDDEISISMNDRPMVTYRADSRLRFPCFSQLTGPASGSPLNPIDVSAAAGFICDNVNQTNYSANSEYANSEYGSNHSGSNHVDSKNNSLYWNNEVNQVNFGLFSEKSQNSDGQIRSRGLQWKGISNRRIRFTDTCDWHDGSGGQPMSDFRQYTVAFYDPYRYGIEVDIRWTAREEVTITANRNCLFGVQVCPALSTEGTMMNSNGRYGVSALWGQPAKWVTCWGKNPRTSGNSTVADPHTVAGITFEKGPTAEEGVALMNHPTNPWGVSPWNVTSEGFMSPTSFPFLRQPWVFRPGQLVRLRYLILAYSGDPNGGSVDEVYRYFSQN